MAIIDFDDECWGDPWFQERAPLERYFFIYLWTNSHRNISGLYTITEKTMCDETLLNLAQVRKIVKQLDPKVLYDPQRSVCLVTKHVRRQFLRSGTISEQMRKGIRKAALKLAYHPFFLNFMDQYPEIFDPSEKDTLYIPYPEGIGGYVYPPGKGKGKGNSFEEKEKVQGEKEKLFEEFWELYPSREGRKLLKVEAGKFFLEKIKDEEVGAVLQAVKNYSVSKAATDGYARDAIRFLRKGFWRGWVERSVPTSQSGFKGARLWLKTKERQDERGRSAAICPDDGKAKGDVPS
jgi:hypothetical protein